MKHSSEQRELVLQLRANGMLIREIVEQVGVPKSTVTRWCNPQFEKKDRAKARQRKFSKRRKCPQCGKRMNNTANLCITCYKASQRYWTRERVIEAMQAWATKHGYSPTYREWSRSGNDHPATATILAGPNPLFNSWSEALVAAGFEPRRHRNPKYKLTRAQRQEIRRKIREDRIKKALETHDVSS